MQRILEKKLNELNRYKGLLVSRSENSKVEIVDRIRGIMEDVELILQDLEYIETPAAENLDGDYRICKSYRDAEEFLD
jgi:hypothetical protein